MTTNRNFVTVVQVNGGTFKVYEPFQDSGYLVGRVGGRTLEVNLENVAHVFDTRY